jgi:heat shock protein HslJ
MDGTGPDRTPLVGTDWVLEALVTLDGAGERVVAPVPALPRAATLRLAQEPDGGLRLAVRPGCNSGAGRADVDQFGPGAGRLRVGPLAVTRMMCDESAMAVEAHVLAVLDGDVDVTLDGDRLRLDRAGRGLVYRAPGETGRPRSPRARAGDGTL